MFKKLIAGIIFYLAIFFLTLLCSLSIIAWELLCKFRKNTLSKQSNAMVGLWGRSVFKVVPGWKVEVEGRENLPKPNDPVVMIANHESLVDILVIYFLKVQFRWLSKASIMRIPILGAAMRASGQIPVIRGDKRSHEAALQASVESLHKGISMFYFPEGTRSEIPGQMRPFKIGAFKLSAECGVDILPIALSGAGKLWRKGGGLPDSATVKIKVLPRTRRLEGETYETYASRVRSTIESALVEMA